MSRFGYTENGALAGIGAGGFSTLASATGQGGEYVFDQTPSEGGKMEGTAAPSGGFVEVRSNTFANDGTPSVDARGTDFEDVLGPGEQQRLYFWERDLDTVTNGANTPDTAARGLAWDGNQYVHTDNDADYIYTMDESFTVTGGTDAPGVSPQGIVWDGTNFVLSDASADYLYLLDSGLSVTGGTAAQSGGPTGIAWDGSRYIYCDNFPDYLYELDSNLSVTGGNSAPAGGPIGIMWEGERFVLADTSAGYLYLLDSNLNVVGGTTPPANSPQGVTWDGGTFSIVDDSVSEVGTGYIYQFGGSFDFMAGIQE